MAQWIQWASEALDGIDGKVQTEAQKLLEQRGGLAAAAGSSAATAPAGVSTQSKGEDKTAKARGGSGKGKNRSGQQSKQRSGQKSIPVEDSTAAATADITSPPLSSSGTTTTTTTTTVVAAKEAGEKELTKGETQQEDINAMLGELDGMGGEAAADPAGGNEGAEEEEEEEEEEQVDTIEQPLPVAVSSSSSSSSLSSSSSSASFPSTVPNNNNNNNNNNNIRLVKDLQAENSQLRVEAQGLREVWNSTREQLAQAKALLQRREEGFKQRIQEQIEKERTSSQEVLYETQRQLAEKVNLIVTYEKRLAAKGQETQGIVSDWDLRSKQQEQTIQALQMEVENLTVSREEKLAEMVEMELEHERVILAMRSAEKATLSVIEQDLHAQAAGKHLMADASLQRESLLEQANAQYAKDLVRMQVEIENKTTAEDELRRERNKLRGQLEQLQGKTQARATEERRGELRIAALEAQIADLQLQHEQKQAASLARERMKQGETEELQAQLLQAKTTLEALEEQRQRHKAGGDGGQGGGGGGGGGGEEASAVTSGLSARLLAKQSELDRALAGRSALQVQLENERAQVRSLELQLRQAKIELQEELDGVSHSGKGADIEEGGYSSSSSSSLGNGSSSGSSSSMLKRRQGDFSLPAIRVNPDFKHRSIQKGVHMLDRFGTTIGVGIRRHQTIRVVFAAYVILLHLFIMYIMYHFSHHPAFEMHGQAGHGPRDMMTMTKEQSAERVQQTKMHELEVQMTKNLGN